jgi:hypothetical protein
MSRRVLRPFVTLAMTAAAAVPVLPATAQAPAAVAGDRLPVPLASWVRVTYWDCGSLEGLPPGSAEPAVCPAVRTEGRVIWGDHDVLGLERRSQVSVVSLSSERILRLERLEDRSLLRGAGTGLRRGALIGAGLALLGCMGGCGDTWRGALGYAGAMIGGSAAVGGTIGLVFGGKRWTSVPWDTPFAASRRRSSLPDVGLGVRISF